MTPAILADLLTEPDWMANAACRELPHEWWFPSVGGNSHTIKKAKEVCAACPVIADCYETAMRLGSQHYDFGIWAATTPRERRAIRKQRAWEEVL